MSGRPIRALALMGPTTAGKTDCAVELVRRWPFEIISVDSAMVYLGMDIGSAKPGPDVLARAPHRMIDILDPAQGFSAYEYARQACGHIKDIHAQGRIPLLVGGARLYFLALTQGLSHIPDVSADIRAHLRLAMAELGAPAMHERLSRCDPLMARRLKPGDSQRILRALGVFESSGQPMSQWLAVPPKAPGGITYHQLALWPTDRARLHRRIEERFDRMLESGLVEEVEGLHGREDLNLECPAMRCVGYRQVWRYLDGECRREQMREQAVAATRQLAKRQLSWLRHAPNVIHCETDCRTPDEAVLAVARWQSSQSGIEAVPE